ncbi:alpha/beta hydrolase [Novosphingobium sp. G106]|uniref:alpha/beta hydrolase n=1 Tax=Novosphingobium sp. G106 TaxID=2849500 RepID=UPI001C2D4BC6|nr:alpha/beta hydrolase fold domain-containing protein [Novosphingobium sp. G106]MBV1687176.1 alpha/beta hydrolase [Novosphingobium sp. G106]
MQAGSGEPASIVDDAERALQFLRVAATRFRGEVSSMPLSSGAVVHRVVPEGRVGRQANAVYMDIHGGGFVAGGGEMCRILAQLRAMDHGVEVWSVDYRLAPAAVFPAALDDCFEAYAGLIAEKKTGDVVLAGSSAGGNLAAATVLRARDEGMAMPAGLLLLTPALDLTWSGDSHCTNRHLDTNLTGSSAAGPGQYVSGDPTNPYLSPLFGDFTRGWPPTFLASGTRDLLLSDAVRMHVALRRCGVPADLYIQEAGSHGGFLGTAPEDHALMAECRTFVARILKLD